MTPGAQGFPSVPGSKCKIRKNPLQLKLFGEFQKAYVLRGILSPGFKKHVFYTVPKPKFQKTRVLHGILSGGGQGQ